MPVLWRSDSKLLVCSFKLLLVDSSIVTSLSELALLLHMQHTDWLQLANVTHQHLNSSVCFDVNKKCMNSLSQFVVCTLQSFGSSWQLRVLPLSVGFIFHLILILLLLSSSVNKILSFCRLENFFIVIIDKALVIYSRSVPMGKKLLQFVDKISQSRYFQQATEYKYIKRAMEEVSNTRLVLDVELRSVVGTLAINIPPPPTDRFW